MYLKEVTTIQDQKDFIRVAVDLYKTDKNWIRPLDQDIAAVFDHRKNKFFRLGEAARWVLYDANDRPVGRVAAFIDKKGARTFEQPTGGMGFFDCIDNKDAAFLLFDTCKEWLVKRGMEAMDGPINFGEKDKWWGLLVDGFFEPTYCMNYNPPHYRRWFEEYGFRNYFEQYNYYMPVGSKLPEKYGEKADRVARNPLYHAEHISKANLEKYADDFRTVYNKAWHKHDNFKGMQREQAMAMLKTIKPIMDEDLIWFVYYDKEPVAFFIMLPEINQIIKYLDGNMNWWGKLKFLYHQKTGTCRKVYGLAFGVVPEHQSRGVEGYIIMAVAKKIQPKRRYDDCEMTWVGDFNPKMIHMVESLGAQKCRTYITFRKLFDESKPFKRAPVIT